VTAPLLVVLAFAVATVVGGWLYCRRVTVDRPPVGVITLTDGLVLVTVLVTMPYVYLALPLAVVTLLLAAAVLAALHLVLQPLLRPPALLWAACLGVIGLDVGLGLVAGVASRPFLLVNNAVLATVVVGAATLWAQSGMRARDVAVLAVLLPAYDVIATWQLTVMSDVFARLGKLPLVPVLAWGLPDPETALRLGLGDLLLLTVWPLVFRTAFGRRAGLVALGTGLAAVAVVLTLLATGAVVGAIPVMIVIGPLIAGQYVLWRRTGPELSVRDRARAEAGGGLPLPR
jgi:hypothetical protein